MQERAVMFSACLTKAFFLLWGIIAFYSPLTGLTNLTKNDPNPVFTTLVPDEFLTTRTRERYYRCDCCLQPEIIKLSISPFRQVADEGIGFRDRLDPNNFYTFLDPNNPANVTGADNKTVYQCTLGTTTNPNTTLQPGISYCLPTSIDKNTFIPLGDITGRWNMLALLYDADSRAKALIAINPYPLYNVQGVTALPTLPFVLNEPVLDAEHQKQNPTVPQYIGKLDTTKAQDINGQLVSPELTQDITLQEFNQLINPLNSDLLYQFGFYTIPARYRKHGIRFESNLQLLDDIGLSVQVSVADVRFEKIFYDLTQRAQEKLGRCPNNQACSDLTSFNNGITGPTPNTVAMQQFTTPQKRFVINFLMADCQRKKLAEAFDLDLCNYHKTGLEDIRLGLYARHVFPINWHLPAQTTADCYGGDYCYPQFLFIPHFHAQAAAPTGQPIKPNEPFAIPLGNNGHASIGFDAGFDFDFLNTVEFGINAGFTHFFSREICGFRVPTECHQNGFIPFKADVRYQPGNNWNFGAKLYAYHFLCNLSFYAQYVMISHAQDDICVLRSASKEKNPEDFMPQILECKSKWESVQINAGFTYDISPNFALGLLWQPTINGRNVFRSSTLLGSIIFTY